MIRGSRDALCAHARDWLSMGALGAGSRKKGGWGQRGRGTAVGGAVPAKSVALSAVGASMMGAHGLEGSLTDCPPSDATEYGKRR